jgi:putative ABC transport system permease protein
MKWLQDLTTKPKTEQTAAAFDREIAYHLETLIEANLANGMTPKEARRQAILEFGGREQITQQLREVHVSIFREAARANIHAAFRFIRHSPSFSATVILTLALGIGANSAVFSAIDAIILRPLAFPHGDELVDIQQHDFKSKQPNTFVAPQRLEDWNRLNSTFQVISGYYTDDLTFTSGDLPEKITEAMVAPRFLQLWGIAPALGRDFTAEEQKFGGPHAILVTDRFWRNRLHANPAAVGKSLHLGSYAYTVIGVMPPSFRFPDRDVDVFEPNPVDAPFAQSRDSTWFIVLGRTKPGVSLDQARADLATVQAQLGKQFPKTDGNLTIEVRPLKSVVLGGVQNSLWLLYGSVSLLLLIACTNIAALLIARTIEREQEISIRYSLGASRAAIVTQLLSEVFALAVIGSLLGLILAAAAAHIFALFAKDLPRVEEITLNWRIVAYSLGCALAANLACGLFPAIRGSRRTLSGSLAHSGRTQVATCNPWQWSLVGVQVSLAVALLIASGLLLRSFQALGRVQPGFDPDHVLTLRISGSWGETADMGKLTQRINRTLEALRGVPGVEAAATSGTIPGNSPGYPAELKVMESPKDLNSKVIADMHIVSPGYFAALHIPVLQGDACRDGLSNTALVNRSFANKYLPDSPAIGRHLLDPERYDFLKPVEIRGVVGDVREQGLDSPPQPTVYSCFSAPGPEPEYLIRTQGDPSAMADIIRRKIHELEPNRSVSNVMPLEDHLSDRLAENRLRTLLLSLFAATAIALVSLGIYGTIGYLARMRRREVGLRLAMGAMPAQIVGRFLLQAMRVTTFGCLAGVAFGLAISRLLTGMLYGVSNLDAVTYASVVALVVTVAATASLIPAIRAAKVDPTEVLREQ